MLGYSLEDALCSVGKGWSEIIKTLYAEKPDEVVICDVKEKYGTLRISTYGADDDFQEKIYDAENASETTCEQCGKPGTLVVVRHWVSCLCEKCKVDREKHFAGGYE